ncbi:MAG TPA: DNA alkylation repair protein, partial [Bacteroidetes bacterium]|nr:DNA alkylation repair protein [Bacteroidota bacterium]
RFIGVRVPDIRKTIKSYKNLSLPELKKTLYSPLHELRLAALLILVQQYKKQDRSGQKKIYDFYLTHKAQVNNWDLVDLSAQHIVGHYIYSYKKNNIKVLHELSASNNIWYRRLSILSTWAYIKHNELEPCFDISGILLADKEDLLHKAVGWMLREAWKRDSEKVEYFIKTNYDQMPRTMLRYAIEKMEESKRKMFLKGKF